MKDKKKGNNYLNNLLIIGTEILLCLLLAWLSALYREYSAEPEYSVEKTLFQNNPIGLLVIIIMIGLVAISVLIYFIVSIVHRDNQMKMASEDIFSAMQHLHCGILNYSDKGKIFYVSKGMFDLIGMEREAFRNTYGGRLDTLFEPEDARAISDYDEISKNGGSLEKEIRIKMQDRADLWLMASVKVSRKTASFIEYTAAFLDVTEMHEMRERIEHSEERYRVVTEISNDIIFEYDYETDTAVFSKKYAEKYGNGTVYKGLLKSLEEGTTHVHPEDKDLVITEILSCDKADFQFRLSDGNGNYTWGHLVGIARVEANGRKYATGKWSNIDALKKEITALETRAVRDPLTGALNKGELVKHITETFLESPNGNHAYIMVDLDNFKGINDNYGHVFGDMVLLFLVNNLQRIARDNELVCRFGGDEFAIFIKNCEIGTLKERVDAFFEAATGVLTSGDIAYKIHVSMGAAETGGEEMSMQRLMELADQALYDVKKPGKNGSRIYEG